ncbi:MAG: methylated-DNA--[protein]-cysteine S-methyltransferase [Chloroflexota bacterium]
MYAIAGSEEAAQCNEAVILGQLKTSLGVFGAALTPAGVGCLTFPAEPFARCEAWARRWAPQAALRQEPAALRALADQLNSYLDGDLRTFSIPVDLRGTPFQVAVWQALQQIGYGEVQSYAAIATAIGRPTAVRAVGAANGVNPVPIIVPCHRVIGSNGTLTGYGGGMELKAWLLRREGNHSVSW